MEHFVSYVPHGGGAGHRERTPGRIQKLASRMLVSAPGPYGLLYVLRAHAPAAATAVVDGIAQDMASGGRAPLDFVPEPFGVAAEKRISRGCGARCASGVWAWAYHFDADVGTVVRLGLRRGWPKLPSGHFMDASVLS